MIIFGTTTLKSTKATGYFNCPRCSMQRTYAHKRANRFFTLYFIPLIPLGSAGEYVECSSCGGTYGVEVLQYNPEAERAETIADFRRTLSLVLLTAGRTDTVYIQALARVCGEVFEFMLPEGQIEEDLRLARAAQAQLVPFVQGRAANLSLEGRKVLLTAAGQVLAVRGSLSGPDQDVLLQLAKALGLGTSPFTSDVSPKGITGPR